MTTFGDIRSAIQAKSKEQLHNALAHYRGPQPTDAETHYIIDAALRHDWNLPTSYDAFGGHRLICDYMNLPYETFADFYPMSTHPIFTEITPDSMRCHINVGLHCYRIGVLPRKAAQQWLLDCVIKPMRLWFIDDGLHVWKRVESSHGSRIESGVIAGLLEDIPRDILNILMRLGDGDEAWGIAAAARANGIKQVCDGLTDAMWHFNNGDTWRLLQDSFDQYVLHYFKLPKENGLTAHQMHEREIELRAQQAFRASAMQSGPYEW